MERELSRIEKKIGEYLNALDRADKEENQNIPNAEEIELVLKKLNLRKVKFEELLLRVEAEGEASTVDPDSRLMGSGGDARPLDVCYNVQTIADDKHSLIVDFDVTNTPSDRGELQNMSEKAKVALEVETITNLADKGYYNGEQIVVCEESGVTCLVAKPKAGGSLKSEGFTLGDFSYDRENNQYICPCQNKLKFMRIDKKTGKRYKVYANYPACRLCPQKPKCTKSRYRQIWRLPYQDILDIIDERTKSNKALYRKRQQIVEHPFGTIKAIWGFKQFLCRGKEKVTAETALAYLAYNLRRAVNLFMADGRDLLLALGG